MNLEQIVEALIELTLALVEGDEDRSSIARRKRLWVPHRPAICYPAV